MVCCAAICIAVKLTVLRKKAIYGHEKGKKVISKIRDIEVRATKAPSWPYYGYNRSKLRSRVKTEAMKKIRYVKHKSLFMESATAMTI